jgi:hypothetical protein
MIDKAPKTQGGVLRQAQTSQQQDSTSKTQAVDWQKLFDQLKAVSTPLVAFILQALLQQLQVKQAQASSVSPAQLKAALQGNEQLKGCCDQCCACLEQAIQAQVQALVHTVNAHCCIHADEDVA